MRAEDGVRQPLRVAMLIQAYHPRIGGAERQLAAVSPLLQAQGVDVHVLTRRYPGLKSFEMVNGIPVHRLPIPGPKPMASLAYTAAALAQLRRLCPDIVHAHGLLSPATTAVAAKRLYGTPVVLTVHDRGPAGELARIRRRSLSRPRLATLRNDVDAFVIISCEVDRELEELGIPPERRPFISNGVDTDRFVPLSPQGKREVRAALGLPDAPTAIYTGRLVPGKQIDRLLAIWDSIRAVHSGATLLLVGSGSEEAALKQAAGPGVVFIGRVDNVLPYLQASDLFVLPSASEGLSVALLEAMSTGLASVATAVGGNLDLIEDEKNGRLVAPDDFATLAEAVLALFSNPELRAEMGRHGRERVLSDYQLNGMAEQLTLLYQRVFADRMPRLAVRA